MATLTYLFPFDHEPTTEEMENHEHVVVDVAFPDGEIVTVPHSLDLPRGEDPIVTITPTQRGSNVWCAGFNTNDVLVQADPSGTARLTISRP